MHAEMMAEVEQLQGRDIDHAVKQLFAVPIT